MLAATILNAPLAARLAAMILNAAQVNLFKTKWDTGLFSRTHEIANLSKKPEKRDWFPDQCSPCGTGREDKEILVQTFQSSGTWNIVVRTNPELEVPKMQRGDLHHDVDELTLHVAAGDDSLGVPSASLVITWALVGVAADPTFPLVVKVLILLI